MASPISTVETIPAKLKETLNELLISGTSLRQIASVTGLSKDAINRYKHRVILPALKTATKIEQVEQAAIVATQDATKRQIARDIVASSPFRADLDRVRTRIYGALERAETDPNTPAVALSPLFAQAHKNLELLGRATGELVEHAATNSGLSVQMMNVLMLPVTKPAPEPAKIVDSRPAECDESSS